MPTYEIVAVVRPDLEEEALGAAIARIHQRVTEHGGTVATTDRWGKRRLAYPIEKYRDGNYVLSVFTLEAGRIAGLRQTLGLHEDLLRFVVSDHHPAPASAASAARPAAPAQSAAVPQAAAPAPSAPAVSPAPAGSEPQTPGAEGTDV